MTARIRRWRKDDPKPPAFPTRKPVPIDLDGPTDAVVSAVVAALEARGVFRRGGRWLRLEREPPRGLRGPRLMPLDGPSLASAIDDASALTRWGCREEAPAWLLNLLADHP